MTLNQCFATFEHLEREKHKNEKSPSITEIVGPTSRYLVFLKGQIRAWYDFAGVCPTPAKLKVRPGREGDEEAEGPSSDAGQGGHAGYRKLT